MQINKYQFLVELSTQLDYSLTMIIRHSQIEQYLQCHRKYYLSHVLGQTEERTSSALAFGSAMHSALQAFIEGGDPFVAFSLYWDSVQGQNLEYDHNYDWETLNRIALDSFLPKFLKGPAMKLRNAESEMTLTAPILGEHTLQGTIDWIGEYDGEFTLGDWKTSKSRYHESKIYKSLQMYIYAYLYLKNFGRLPDYLRYTVFVKTDRGLQNNLSIKLTNELVMHRMGIVEEIVKDIVRRVEAKDEKVWFPNPGCFCTNKCFSGGKQ